MAQIIKNRRGSLERISAVSSSFQKGELIITSGSSNLTTTNGSSILFAATESGSVQAVNRFLMGTNAPNIFSSSIYNGLVKGVPYYASGSSTLYLLGSDKNDIPDLTGNISNFSSSVANSINALSASIGGGSIGNSVTLLSSKTGSYATTGSNVFKGEQIISSSLLVTNEIKGTGSIFLQPDQNDSRDFRIYNTAPSDIHIKGNAAYSFFGDDTNYLLINDSAQTATIVGVNGVFVSSSLNVTGSISSSVGISGSINGIGNVSAYSSSVDSRFSASAYNVAELSASVASVGGTFSSSVATDFSASTAARVALSASIASDVNTLSSSIYQTDATQSNAITNNSSSFATSLSASVASQTALSASIATTDSASAANVTAISGAVATSFSASAASITSVSASLSSVSGAFATSTSASNYQITELSASVASVGGTFSSSVATTISASKAEYTSFSASAASDLNSVSASIATTDNTQTGRINALETYSSSLKTAIELTGSSVTIQGDLLVRGTTTSVNSTTIDLGDNIINLNGSGATNGGLYVKDVTNPNTATGSLLWDSTNDYWKAGVKDSEAKVLVAVGDNVFSSSIQTAFSGTFGYNDFSSSVATSFSASAANVSSISGAFATSTSASNYQITQLSASVASVGGTFSSSVATDFSASAYVVSTLSGSIYLTDATQSNAITNNSSSFATAVSGSNYRITILETTIDGGSF